MANVFKKIWSFLTESNSVWSWIIDIILIFLIMKFLIMPGIGLLLGTPVPLVIVESGSMEHDGDFDTWFVRSGYWYLDNNITKEEISSWKFHNGMNKGDIVVVRGLRNKKYEIGDVIVFRVPGRATPIIHRIVEIRYELGVKIYSTKGDHNNGQWDYEKTIYDYQILGKAVGRVPWLGWVKLFFVQLFNPSS